MPKAIILRLEGYLSYLAQLETEGKTKATSRELSNLFGLSSSRVRQDMVGLGVVGRPRAGYEIEEMRARIRETLDLNNLKRIVLVGYGNLGRALAHSDIWQNGGFVLQAIFDMNPLLVGTEINSLKIRSMTELFGVIKSESIEAGCIAVPGDSAQQIAELLATAGIRGIWNFAPVELSVPEGVIVENQRLEQGLMTLSYNLKEEFQ